MLGYIAHMPIIIAKRNEENPLVFMRTRSIHCQLSSQCIDAT